MSPALRNLVEKQLLSDLAHYGVVQEGLRFDWSESCIEGHSANYLNSSLENYSGISLYNSDDEYVAHGWMEFILAGEFFLVFWDFLTIRENSRQISDKNQPGIPDHVWQQLPQDIRGSYQKERMTQPPFRKPVL
ncbi:hypothetical protein E5K00_08220 [Hymenobacter aquaticus]|uniref:Uncharacterized protein n=1 Tax=Hymenobacter aquaticus TaxID=1867101 RepID=A0A4Z0Q6X2_9BACT|nr:hypothetical protein [Hymenobacter aquaticus]TGE25169.1 hypothetical protein E5K00_08220 [Hymenobacter aquaticus]